MYVEYGINDAYVVQNLSLPEPKHANDIQEDVEVEDDPENNDEKIRRARAEVDTENVSLGENDDVQSQYYDSDDPLSYQSEKEEVEATFEQTTNVATSRFKYPSYNPNVESVELEVGALYDDRKQFKKAISQNKGL
nr:uncharacterized protein LOC109164765 [Ipomoea batatas]